MYIYEGMIQVKSVEFVQQYVSIRLQLWAASVFAIRIKQPISMHPVQTIKGLAKEKSF